MSVEPLLAPANALIIYLGKFLFQSVGIEGRGCVLRIYFLKYSQSTKVGHLPITAVGWLISNLTQFTEWAVPIQG